MNGNRAPPHHHGRPGDLDNGDFTATGAGGFDDGDRPFSDTADWTNVPPATGSDTTQCTRNNPAGLDSTGANTGASGGCTAVVNEAGDRIFGNDPQHTIALDDVFDVNLRRIAAFDWNDALDRIEVALYVTDNDLIDGTRMTSAAALAPTAVASGAYELFEANALYTAGATHVGNNMFVGAPRSGRQRRNRRLRPGGRFRDAGHPGARAGARCCSR